MTGVLTRERGGRFEIQRHTGEKATWKRRQRLKQYSLKPRSTADRQQPPAAGREAWNESPPEPQKEPLLLTPSFQTLASRAVRFLLPSATKLVAICCSSHKKQIQRRWFGARSARSGLPSRRCCDASLLWSWGCQSCKQPHTSASVSRARLTGFSVCQDAQKAGRHQPGGQREGHLVDFRALPLVISEVTLGTCHLSD